MPHRFSMPLTMLLLGGAAALTFAWLRIDDVIEAPPATTAAPITPEATRPQGPRPARVEVTPTAVEQDADAVAEAEEDTPLPTLTDAKLPAAFDSRDLVAAGVAKEIADGMAKIMDEVAKNLDVLVQIRASRTHRYPSEFLLATWPDLGNLIREGKLKLDVVAFPPHNWSAPKVPLVVGYDGDAKSLSYAMSMERWSVHFEFTAKSAPNPELFAQLVAALESER